MNKLVIPSILVATVMLAGIFAFIPVQDASTVHTSGTITTANTVGIVCFTEDPITLGGTPDNDIITFSFSQPVEILQIIVLSDNTLTGDALDFDLITVDGAQWGTVGFGAIDVTDAVSGSILSDTGSGQSSMFVENSFTLTINDASLDGSEQLIFEFCVLTSDAQDFDKTDITVEQSEV